MSEILPVGSLDAQLLNSMEISNGFCGMRVFCVSNSKPVNEIKKDEGQRENEKAPPVNFF